MPEQRHGRAAQAADTPAEDALTKKAATKKAATKKAATKKAATKQTTAKKATAKKAATPGDATKADTQRRRRAEALAVAADESPWTPEELAELCADLEAEVKRLQQEVHTAESELADVLRGGRDGAGDDQADAGSATFEREHEMSLARNSRELLSQVQHALQRIEDGTYGICEGCQNPIGKARSQVFPRATLCVACKQLEERR